MPYSSRSSTITYPFLIRRFCFAMDSSFPPNYVFEGEPHNFWEFTIVLEGDLEVTVNDKVYLLTSNDFLTIAPMEFHRSRSHGTSSPHFFGFAFETFDEFPQVLKSSVFQVTESESAELHTLFHRLRQIFSAQSPTSQSWAEIACAFSSFLLRLFLYHAPMDRSYHSGSIDTYQRLVQTMHATLYDNLTIHEIAKRCFVSDSTVKKLFLTYAGIGPKQYYSTLRGMEARKLLGRGVSISEITERMNYASTSYFSTSFKKQFGLPPGAHQKQSLRNASSKSAVLPNTNASSSFDEG